MAGTSKKDRYVDTNRAQDAKRGPRPKQGSPVPPSVREVDRERDYAPFGG